MKVRHRFTLKARCPVNDAHDFYECDVFLAQTVPVERLLFLAVGFETVRAYQEDITQLLADRIGAKVRTIGEHAGGKVKTVCVCWPRCLLVGLPGEMLQSERTALPVVPAPQPAP